MQIVFFVLALVLLIGLVLAHEWGHFIIARRNKVVAEEFGLGLPPRAYGRRLKSGLLLSVNWLPIGGFVNLKRQHDAEKAKGSFGAASLGAKSRILLAGVAMNALIGLVLLTILAAIGMPVLLTRDNTGQNQFTVASDTRTIRQEVDFGDVLPGSPADKAGFRSTDTLLAVNSAPISSATQLHDMTKNLAGQTINIKYSRVGKVSSKSVKLLSVAEVNASQKTNNPKGYLGIVPNQMTIRRSTWSSPVVAAGLSGQIAWLTLKGVGQAFAGLGSTIAGGLSGNHAARENGQTAATSQIGGPIAIAKVLWASGSLGFNFVLLIIAVMSLTLALINVLPIPALDGGRLAIILLSRLFLKRPLSKKSEERIVNSGMALVMALLVLIIIADVNRFF